MSVRKIGSKTGVLAAVDEQRAELFLFSKDTGLFHRDRQMASEVFFPDPMEGARFEAVAVSEAEAGRMMKTARGLNANFSVQAQMLEELFAQASRTGEALTAAEVGLSMDVLASVARPTAAKGLGPLMSRGKWVTLYRYERDPQSTRVREARAALKQNKKLGAIAQAAGRVIEIETVDDPGQGKTLIRVRLNGKAQAGASLREDLVSAGSGRRRALRAV